MYKLIFVSCLIIIAGLGIFLIFSNKQTEIESPSSQNPPSPLPFWEMTVHYLRSQNYQSGLGDLQKISENQNYISYLTSYTSDGLKINGLLTKPAGNPPAGGWPAVVFIHGYIAPSTYQTLGQSYSAYVDYLARNSLVVFKIDLRGHGSSEGEPGGAYYSSDYVIDTLNAYAALKSSGFVNPQRIGLWGHSMAGNVVLRSLAAKPDIPAAVIWAGAVYSYEDFTKYRLNDQSYSAPQMTSERRKKRQELFDTYGEFNKDSPFWKQVAATNYLNELKGAIQLHHAVDDKVVNIEYSRDLIKLLDKTSIVHEFYEYQNGGHNLTGSSFTQAMQRIVEFFNTYLK